MLILVLRSLSILLTILQAALAVYIFLSFLPVSKWFFEVIKSFLWPVLQPFQFLVNHSVFGKHMSDLVPVITFFGLAYLQKIITIGLG